MSSIAGSPNKGAMHRMSGRHACSGFGWLCMPLIGDLGRYKAVSAPVELKKIEPAAPEPARWIETGPLGLGPGARRLRTPFAQRRRSASKEILCIRLSVLYSAKELKQQWTLNEAVTGHP